MPAGRLGWRWRWEYIVVGWGGGGHQFYFAFVSVQDYGERCKAGLRWGNSSCAALSAVLWGGSLTRFVFAQALGLSILHCT